MIDTSEPPIEWLEALARIGSEYHRVVVVGGTDLGKSSFINLAVARLAGSVGLVRLLDLDPGQKMLGPPGTASLGGAVEDGFLLDRFIFLGSTSATQISAIVDAAERLAETIPLDSLLLVNTSGFIQDGGIRLQSATIAAVGADLIIAIGPPESTAIIRAAVPCVPDIVLPASPHARRKSPGRRAAVRQQALEEALADTRLLDLSISGVRFEPGNPLAWPSQDRPVCGLADAEGRDMEVGILLDVKGERALVHARCPQRSVGRIRLGRMWARPAGMRWQLLEKLEPAWEKEERCGPLQPLMDGER